MKNHVCSRPMWHFLWWTFYCTLIFRPIFLIFIEIFLDKLEQKFMSYFFNYLQQAAQKLCIDCRGIPREENFAKIGKSSLIFKWAKSYTQLFQAAKFGAPMYTMELFTPHDILFYFFCNISGRNKTEVKATNVLRLCEEAVFCLNFLYGKLMQGGRKGEPGRGPGLPI